MDTKAKSDATVKRILPEIVSKIELNNKTLLYLTDQLSDCLARNSDVPLEAPTLAPVDQGLPLLRRIDTIIVNQSILLDNLQQRVSLLTEIL